MSEISPQQKEGSSKKKEMKKMIEKQKRWNLIRKAPYFKRREEKEDEICKLLGEILLKERKDTTLSYSAKSNMWPHPYPHIICICTIFNSLTFPFLTTTTTPFSINHDYLPQKLFRNFHCFYIIQSVA
jgi:hypothetical protein